MKSKQVTIYVLYVTSGAVAVHKLLVTSRSQPSCPHGTASNKAIHTGLESRPKRSKFTNGFYSRL